MASGELTVRELGGALALFADARRGGQADDLAGLAAAAAATLASRLAAAPAVLWAQQRHTALSYVYSSATPTAPGAACVGVCDAILTAEPGVALLVRTADCLPIALAGGGAVAIVHAGWRGLAADILGRVAGRLMGELGVPPAELAAVVGVGVGPCHYPVGAEVVAALASLPLGDTVWHRLGAVDLAAVARGRLLALGVPEKAVESLPGCTACSPLHHSWRRDGTGAGRQWAAVIRR